jgi:hypothetical protein
VTWFKRPSTTGGIFYLIVVGVVIAGLVLVALGTWRSGMTLAGLGFGLAFVMRLVLPDNHAGMLRVRRRLVDLATLAMCSGVMIAMAVLIPNRPTRR